MLNEAVQHGRLSRTHNVEVLIQNTHTLRRPWERIIFIRHINKDHLITKVSARKSNTTITHKGRCSIVSEVGRQNVSFLVRSYFSMFVRGDVNQCLKQVNRASWMRITFLEDVTHFLW